MRYEMMISHDLLLPVGMCTLHVPVVLGLPKVPGYFKILFTGMTHSTQRAMVSSKHQKSWKNLKCDNDTKTIASWHQSDAFVLVPYNDNKRSRFGFS
jgi:hypothetical protein